MKIKYANEYSNLKKVDIKVLKVMKYAFDFTKRNTAGKCLLNSNEAFRNIIVLSVDMSLSYGLTEDFTLIQIQTAF